MNDFDKLRATLDLLGIKYETKTEKDITHYERYFGWGDFEGIFKAIKIVDLPQYINFCFDINDKYLGHSIWSTEYDPNNY